MVARPEQLGGQERPQARAAWISLRRMLERGLEHRHPLDIDESRRAEVPAAVGEGGAHELVSVAGRLGGAGDVEQGLAELGDAGLQLSFAEREQKLAPIGRIGLGQTGVQLERLLEPADRLVGGELRQRGPAGAGGVVARLRLRSGLGDRGPMLRELAQAGFGVVGAAPLQRLRNALVQPGTARAGEFVAEGVVDQRVHEGEPPGPVARLSHQRRRGGRFQDVDRIVLADAGHAGEQVDVELAPDDRGRAKDALGVWAESRHAPADDLVDARR